MKNFLILVCGVVVFQTKLFAQLPDLGLGGPSYKASLYYVPEKTLVGVKTMAVLPFDGINNGYYNNDLKFGSQIADKMTQILQQDTRGGLANRIFSERLPTNIYKMVDRTEVQRIIEREQIKSVEGSIDQGSVVKLGSLLSAQGFVTGTFIIEPKPVTQSTTKNKDGKITSYSISRTVIFKTTLRITKVETAEPLVFTFEESESDSKSSDSGYPSQNTLETVDNLVFKAIDNVIGRMCGVFSPFYTTVKIDLEKTKVKEQKDRFKEAFDYLDKGDLANACGIFNAIYKDDEYNPQLNFNIGAIYFGSGNYAKAAEWFDKAYKLSNQSEKSYAKYTQTAKDYLRTLPLIKEMGVELNSVDYCNGGETGDPSPTVYINGSEKEPALIFEQMGSGSTPKMLRIRLKVKKINTKDNWFEVEMPTGERRFVEAKYIGK